MSLERELQEALARHKDDVRERPDAWQGVERAVKRAHTRRAAAAAALSVALIAAGGVALVLNNDRAPSPGGFATGDASPSPSLSPSPSSETYRDERDGWWLRYPTTWRASRFEGHTNFVPPDAKPEEPEFQIDLFSDPHAFADLPFAGESKGSATSATVAGHDALVVSTDRSVQYSVDWTDVICGLPSSAAHPRCTSETRWTLMVSFYATDAETLQKFDDAESLVIRTLRTTDEYPTGGVRGRYGAVGGAVRYDALTAALVDFLDRRVEGGEAEFYLTKESRAQFDREGDPSPALYAITHGSDQPENWVAYTIVSRDDADANSSEFFVRMTLYDGSGEEERIGVGPGTNLVGDSLPGIIRFATLDNQFDAPDGR